MGNKVFTEIAKKKRTCYYCRKDLPAGTRCIKFDINYGSVCKDCFGKYAIKILGVDKFEKKFAIKMTAHMI